MGQIKLYNLCLSELIYFVSFWLHHETYRILVPQQGIEPVHPAVEVCRLNHWTAGKLPSLSVKQGPHLSYNDVGIK